MREILFKAKRTDNGEWVEGALLNSDEEYRIATSFLSGDSDNNVAVMVATYKVEPETICQYTGLTDKNGRKIWENDIVCCEKRGAAFYICRVVWNGKQARFDVIASEISFPMTLEECNADMSICGEDYKLLRNIFDNPALLKGGDNP